MKIRALEKLNKKKINAKFGVFFNEVYIYIYTLDVYKYNQIGLKILTLKSHRRFNETCIIYIYIYIY